jgi:hypothetical protein
VLWLIDTLRRFASWLENRRKLPTEFVSLETLVHLENSLREANAEQGQYAAAIRTDVEKMKQQIEILNLRVGLSRPMQTVLRNKSNG